MVSPSFPNNVTDFCTNVSVALSLSLKGFSILGLEGKNQRSRVKNQAGFLQI